jgi:hypothetical protein
MHKWCTIHEFGFIFKKNKHKKKKNQTNMIGVEEDVEMVL